jgi:hypothetical protein
MIFRQERFAEQNIKGIFIFIKRGLYLPEDSKKKISVNGIAKKNR